MSKIDARIKSVLERYADELHGNQYRDEGYPELWKKMSQDNCVAVFGASDDLVYFGGAIDDERGARHNHDILIVEDGLFDEDECGCKYAELAKKKARVITALWDQDGYSWTYKTDIPHVTFDIMEDDEKYCRGIIFCLDNL